MGMLLAADQRRLLPLQLLLMIKSYLKIAWRNLIKDRQFTLLNLLGLSVGLACALLIGLWVVDEQGMEKYNAGDARLYQVMGNFSENNGILTGSGTPGGLARALRTDIPEIADASSVLPASWFGNGGVAGYADKKLQARPQYVDSNYFALFTCPWLQGDRDQLFADKQGVALSSEFATRLFGSTRDVIGKSIHYDHYDFSGDFVVRGIFQPNPANATEHFDLLFNYAVVLEKRTGLSGWNDSDPNTFVLVRPGTNIAAVNKKIARFWTLKAGHPAPEIFLTRFADRYLYNQYENGVQSGGRIIYVRVFTILAFFILIIACINFMNLSTAKAAYRGREVGIKKVVGASRRALILQYLGESVLLSLLSLAGAMLIVWLLLPVFNSITGKSLSLHPGPAMLVGAIGVAVVTGLFAGSYPAFYLSGFRPVAVLKGTVKTSLGELLARKGLVVFQFTLSVIFIAGVLVIYRQISYIQSRDLGYDREHVIHFEIPFSMDSAKTAAGMAFVNELKSLPGVENAGSYGHNLMGDHGDIDGLQWAGKDPALNIHFANIEVGYNFLETMGIRLVAGRYYSPNANADHEIIMNQTAIRAMGLKHPIGTIIKYWDQKKEIIGVAADFNFESLYQQVKPAFFWVHPLGPSVIVRLRSGSEERAIAGIRAAYKQFNPGMPFEYTYMNDDYTHWYASEIRAGELSRYFAGLAILISCLGLFGLAAFTAQKRKKEIGIRKVVGASTTRITYLLTREFLVLVAVSIVIAFPVVLVGMHRWLDAFAYRTTIGADIFVFTALTALVVTLATIGFQAVRAARANPVDSLRSE
ncbi:MAG TPA: FtsX-like permease family protein [Puia sp.]|nr:FtsX-like permease family protein [Puia sp.]